METSLSSGSNSISYHDFHLVNSWNLTRLLAGSLELYHIHGKSQALAFTNTKYSSEYLLLKYCLFANSQNLVDP